jgi:ribosome-binding protein aMBF1 (putative translation factor)
MYCYKCTSEIDLSAKKMNRDGSVTFICRACRREEYQRRKLLNPKPVTDPNAVAFNAKEWAKMAKERHKKLSEKYRDEEFMKARGLL